MPILQDGSMIKQDVIASFEKAINNDENRNEDFTFNWDFVSADMMFDLGGIYNYDYIDECMETLIDYFGYAEDGCYVGG